MRDRSDADTGVPVVSCMLHCSACCHERARKLAVWRGGIVAARQFPRADSMTTENQNFDEFYGCAFEDLVLVCRLPTVTP